MSGTEIEEPRPRRMLDIKQVLAIVPVSRATLYRMVEQKKFPPSTPLTAQRRVWFEDEIVAWQEGLGRRSTRPSARSLSAACR